VRGEDSYLTDALGTGERQDKPSFTSYIGRMRKSIGLRRIGQAGPLKPSLALSPKQPRRKCHPLPVHQVARPTLATSGSRVRGLAVIGVVAASTMLAYPSSVVGRVAVSHPAQLAVRPDAAGPSTATRTPSKSVSRPSLNGLIGAAPGRMPPVLPGLTLPPVRVQTPVGAPPPIPGLWRPILSENFSGTTLPTIWHTCWWYSPRGCSNGSSEGQWYLPQNVIVRNGYLSLVAEKRTITNVTMPGDSEHDYKYTSGMVNSEGGFQFKFGYVQWRAKLPVGQGLWPALWLLPADNSWPPEIDALEVVGDQPNVWTGTSHSASGTSQGFDFKIAGLSRGWHTFGVDWEPGRITWYVDGHAVAADVSAGVSDTPMYLVMDLAVGGSWPGYPNGTTPFPSSLEVSAVRVWQHPGAGNI